MANTPRVDCSECRANNQEPPHTFQQEGWKAQIFDRMPEFDREHEHWHDRYSLCLGWAIGRGMTPDAALNFALHIRYHTELG